MRGVVRDAVSGEPILAVDVRHEPSGRSTITDGLGRFSMALPGDGPFTLVLERLGYASATVEIGAASSRGPGEFFLQPAQFDVEGVTVQADRARAEADIRAPVTSTRLGAEEIQRRRGQTLGHTIEEVPGVAIIQYGPSIAKPVVRGLHSQRIVVSNGGVRQEGQQWGGEHAPEIDIFSAQEIRVVRGPGGIVYGPDALGGVVQVEPGALPDEGGWQGEVVGNAFANNRQGAGSLMMENGALSLPWLGETAMRFRVSTRRAGDASTPDYNLNNTGFGELSLSGGLGWEGDWGSSEILLSRYSAELGLYTGAHFGNFEDLMRAMEGGPVPSEFSYGIGTPRQEITHDKILFRNRIRVPGGNTLEARYGFQFNRRREFDHNGPLSRTGRPSIGLDLYTHTLDASYAFETGAGTTQVGLNGMRQGNLSVGRAYLIPQYRLYTGGVYLKQDTEVGPLVVSAAGRFDYRWQRVFPVEDRTFLTEARTDVYDDFAGSLGVTWEFAPDWYLGSNVGRAWRQPNVNERFSEGVHHGTAQYEIGDADLIPERTFNTDVTLRKGGDRFSFQVNAFRNAIADYIYLRPRDPVLTIRGAYPAYNYEQVNAVVRGVEMDLDLAVRQGLNVFAHGSVTRGEEADTEIPLFDMPADRMRLGVRGFAPLGRSGARVFGEVSGLLVRDQNEVPPVTIYALPTEGYQLLDLSVGVESLWIGGVPVDASLDVSNLLGRSYRDYLSRYKLFVDDPGRDVVLRFRVPLGG